MAVEFVMGTEGRTDPRVTQFVQLGIIFSVNLERGKLAVWFAVIRRCTSRACVDRGNLLYG